MKIKNNLDKKEVDKLYALKQKKGITNIQIAKDLNYVHSAISAFFNIYQACETKYESIKMYIENYSEHIKIPQIFYGRLEIDTREKDVVIIAMVEKTETNLIQVERRNISKLIKVLKNEQKNYLNDGE